MKLLAKMYALVPQKFEGVFDKQGKPYFEHCLYVMRHCKLEDEDSLCIALGHDLKEDTDINDAYLLKHFNPRIAGGIDILTHRPEESYEEYIKRILNNNFGSTVEENKRIIKIKMTDLEHNTHVSRLKGLTEKDFERLEKYHKAYTLLKNKYYV